MKIGLLYDLRNPGRWFRPFPQFYAETLDHMQAMDELGFDSLNITEHHFDEDGYCPSPIVWNAAMAVRTKRALLGQEEVVVAELIGDLDLIERLLVEPVFGVGIPGLAVEGLGQLVLVEEAEFHCN